MADEFYMNRCLDLAHNGAGKTSPNPMVGAVLVHNGRIIGEGWHHHYGGSHAEVNCLENVPEHERHLIPESTMYVSLEPCAHFGLTPPCAYRLVAERIPKVVICSDDPFDRVDGKGMAILRDAGCQVVSHVMEEHGAWLNRRFFCFHQKKRPYIILKWAQTADGFIAPEGGKRVKISCEESQELLHRWRREEDSIMVGYRTALNDNPKLTARPHDGRQPLRIALDCNCTLPATHNLFNISAATWIVNNLRETVSGNVHYINLPFNDNLLPSLMKRLHEAKILSIIVEGGAHLLNAFIRQGLWDEARVFTSPNTMGKGISAPLLHDNVFATEINSGVDKLELFTHSATPWPYVQGMEL